MVEKKSKLEQALENQGLSEADVLKLIKSSRSKPSRRKKIGGKEQSVKYGYFSDAHIGHEKFDTELFYEMADRFNKEKVDFVVDPGDHMEGMSGRPGHVYELNHVGFNAQLDEVIRLYSLIKSDIFGIDGNHDLWYKAKNSAGVIPGEIMQQHLPNYTHLGEWEGDLEVGTGLWLKLFHGNDGTAYAHSYKLQKLVESFAGGQKPHIVHSGHYHKALYQHSRNVHGFESGTLCGQSIFMRGKKLQAHKGYGLVEVWFDRKGVNRLKHEWIPGYE